MFVRVWLEITKLQTRVKRKQRSLQYNVLSFTFSFLTKDVVKLETIKAEQKMPSPWEVIGQVTLSLVYIFGCIFGNLGAYIIRSYHNSKPLGMQTLLGKVIMVETHIYTLEITVYGILFSTSSTLSQYGYINDTVAKIGTVLAYVSFLLFFLGMFMCILTKYCSIYHGSFLNALDEDTILGNVKLILALVPLTLALLEYVLITPVNESPIYLLLRHGRAEGTPSAEKAKLLLILSTLIAMIVLYVRIEHDHFQFKESSSLTSWALKLSKWFTSCQPAENNNSNEQQQQQQQNDNEQSSPAYGTTATRAVATLGFMLSGVIVYQLVGDKIDTRYTIAFSYVIITVMAPFTVILNHEGLKKMVIPKLSIAISCLPERLMRIE